MSRTGVLIACAAATACAGPHTVPIPRVERIDVPVPVLCVQSPPQLPQLASDRALQALADGDLVRTLWIERNALRGYALEAEAVLKGCSAGT